MMMKMMKNCVIWKIQKNNLEWIYNKNWTRKKINWKKDFLCKNLFFWFTAHTKNTESEKKMN